MKKDEMINVNFMEIVHEICTTASTDCRSLNKSDLSRKLMDLVNIPQNAEIQEIPLDWEDQVDVCFTIPNDDNYYSLLDIKKGKYFEHFFEFISGDEIRFICEEVEFHEYPYYKDEED